MHSGRRVEAGGWLGSGVFWRNESCCEGVNVCCVNYSRSRMIRPSELDKTRGCRVLIWHLTASHQKANWQLSNRKSQGSSSQAPKAVGENGASRSQLFFTPKPKASWARLQQRVSEVQAPKHQICIHIYMCIYIYMYI